MKKMVDSFNAAIEGFFYVLKKERNMRIHFIVGVIVILFAIYLNFTRVELLVLCLTIGLVLITEMVNTAIEIILNKLNRQYAYWIKRVKDITAGAVLISSLNAVIVGYFLFFRDVIFKQLNRGMIKISKSDWHISFFILITIVGIVIIIKSFFHKGRPLRGGMPSGHSAVAFSIAALVMLISQNILLTVAVVVLAVLIAQSRVSRHYHSVWEVMAGSLIGFFGTVIIYKLLVG